MEKAAGNLSKLWGNLHTTFIYRINDSQGSIASPNSIKPLILEKVCKERGWKEFEAIRRTTFSSYYNRDFGWNIWWQTTMRLNTRNLLFWQYTNHIPRADFICNKEKLVQQLRSMESQFGKACFDFLPNSFILPREMDALIQEHRILSQIKCTRDGRNLIERPPSTSDSFHLANSDDNKGVGDGDRPSSESGGLRGRRRKRIKPVWIYKPTGKSQGKGIIIVDNPELLAFYPNGIVQEYIARPLLIRGFKFDLRLYVVIVSVSPLTVYAYQEGLVRFATEKYNTKALENIYSHLTNTSINKNGPGFGEVKDGIGKGCKWTFAKLRKHLEESGVSDWLLWQQIISIITITILGELDIRGTFPHNCFEFLGFDILIDEELNPWLLEVNCSPGLGGGCEVDEIVKRPMLHELFDLIGLPKKGSRAETAHVKPNKVERLRSSKMTPMTPSKAVKLALGSKAKEMQKETLQIKMRIIKKYPKVSKGETRREVYLRSRFEDLVGVYCKNLVPSTQGHLGVGKAEPNAPKTPQRPKTKPSLNNRMETPKNLLLEASSKGREPVKRKSWAEPPLRSGDWTLIFPFDRISQNISKGKVLSKTKLIINKINRQLHSAKELTRLNPKHSDHFYSTELKKLNNLHVPVWLPHKE